MITVATRRYHERPAPANNRRPGEVCVSTSQTCNLCNAMLMSNEVRNTLWERTYRRCFYGLLAVVAALVLWKTAPTMWEALRSGGWRPRAAVTFLVGWCVIMRLATRTDFFHRLANSWEGSGLFGVLGWNMLFWGLPVGIFTYLCPLQHRGEAFMSLALMWVGLSIAEWVLREHNHSDSSQ